MSNMLPELGAFEWAMLGVAIALFALFLHIFNKVPRIREAPRSTRAALALLSVWAIAYGGSKGPIGRVTVNDPYIRDAGSVLTNNVARIVIAKKSALLPDDTEILVYARELSQTNAADWVRLTPHLTFIQHPHDYLLPGLATNYNVMVAASFVPGPTVHTNGVWSITGFVIPGGGGGRMSFKQTITIIKEDEE